MEGVEVPSYFLCPISLQTMRDPVTLTTGMTYDRDSIERWIFSEHHRTCPATKQPLSLTSDLTPNHTLRRLIQSWCAANAVERFPTPRPPVDRSQIAELVNAARTPRSQTDSLRKLRSIVSESDRNRLTVEACGGADFAATVIIKNGLEYSSNPWGESIDEALGTLHALQLSEQGLLNLVQNNPCLVGTLSAVLLRCNNQSRAYGVLILKSLFSVPLRMNSVPDELFEEIVRVLKDRISYQSTKAALQVLNRLCAMGRNRVMMIRAVEAGAVAVLLGLLLEEHERRPTEMIMVVLDRLCECAEGRAALAGHAAGIAVVAKRMVRVSSVASEQAVGILYSIATATASEGAAVREMLESGAVRRMCMLLQLECGVKTRERVKEMLRLHSRVWSKSHCLAPHLQASYPSL